MRVFVSYRRSDAAGHAGRLHDDLVERLEPGSVFQDVASIAPGERFLDAIDRSIGGCDAVLVVIGRRWMDIDERTGRRRLNEPADVVRGELEAALRTGRRLIPVLVDRATLPEPADLPPTLRPLIERNAIELRDEAWGSDLQRLYAALGVPDERSRRRPPWILPALAIAAAVIIGIVLAVVKPFGGVSADTSQPPQVSLPTATPQPWPVEQTVASTYHGEDGSGQVVFTVVAWWLVTDAGNTTTVSVRIKVTNETTVAIAPYPEQFHLLVDRIPQPDPDVGRLGVRDGPPPQQATEHLVVFSHVPAGRRLELICGYDADQKSVILQGG